MTFARSFRLVVGLVLFGAAFAASWFPDLIPDSLEALMPVIGGGSLAMACSPNLGHALARGCPAMPLQRDWRHVEAIDSTRAAPGREVFVNFKAIAPQDSRGRHAHVRSLRIAGKVRVTAGANNDAVSAHRMRGIFQQIKLSDHSGWDYLFGLDGRSIIDDSYFRGGRFRMQGPLGGSIAANVGAGNVDRDIELVIDLVGQAPGASPVEGLILLASLQAADSQAFRFRLASVLPGTPAGLTVASFLRNDGTAGLDVWADVVYLDEAIVESRWGLREYTKTEKSGQLDHPDARHEYIVARYFAEDSGGQNAVASIDGVSLQVGGMAALAGARQIDLTERQSFLVESEPGSSANLGLTSLDIPTESGLAALILLPPRPREHAPAGPVAYRFTTQPAANTRFLHRFALCDDGERAMKILREATTSPCEVGQLVGGTFVRGIHDPTAPKVFVPKAA